MYIYDIICDIGFKPDYLKINLGSIVHIGAGMPIRLSRYRHGGIGNNGYELHCRSITTESNTIGYYNDTDGFSHINSPAQNTSRRLNYGYESFADYVTASDISVTYGENSGYYLPVCYDEDAWAESRLAVHPMNITRYGVAGSKANCVCDIPVRAAKLALRYKAAGDNLYYQIYDPSDDSTKHTTKLSAAETFTWFEEDIASWFSRDYRIRFLQSDGDYDSFLDVFVFTS